MTGTGAALALALSAISGLGPFELTTLDDALQALSEGQPLEGISAAVADEAVERIRRGTATSGEEVAACARVARAGRRELQLALILVEATAHSIDATGHALALAGLSPPIHQLAWSRASDDARPRALAALERVALGDDEAGGLAAARVLGGYADGATTIHLLGEWSRRLANGAESDTSDAARTGACIEVLSRREELPPGVIDAITTLSDLGAAHPLLEGALARLVAREPVAKQVLDAVRLNRLGPRAVLVRVLDRVPPALWPEAGPLALSNVESDDPAVVIASLQAGAGLRQVDLVEIAPQLATDRATPLPIRLAAIEAWKHVGYPDAPTVEALIALLDDPDLRAVSGEALSTLTQHEFPPDPLRWRTWFANSDLPDVPPEDAETRLDRAREALARTWAPPR